MRVEGQKCCFQLAWCLFGWLSLTCLYYSLDHHSILICCHQRKGNASRSSHSVMTATSMNGVAAATSCFTYILHPLFYWCFIWWLKRSVEGYYQSVSLIWIWKSTFKTSQVEPHYFALTREGHAQGYYSVQARWLWVVSGWWVPLPHALVYDVVTALSLSSWDGQVTKIYYHYWMDLLLIIWLGSFYFRISFST